MSTIKQRRMRNQNERQPLPDKETGIIVPRNELRFFGLYACEKKLCMFLNLPLDGRAPFTRLLVGQIGLAHTLEILSSKMAV